MEFNIARGQYCNIALELQANTKFYRPGLRRRPSIYNVMFQTIQALYFHLSAYDPDKYIKYTLTIQISHGCMLSSCTNPFMGPLHDDRKYNCIVDLGEVWGQVNLLSATHTERTMQKKKGGQC